MASFISNTVFDALKRDFELAMIKLVGDIATGEGLDPQELQDKYLKDISFGKAPKAKAPRKAKVTVIVDPDETQDPNAVPMPTACNCMTAKGGPCKLKPLFGTAMCSIHTKKAEAERGMPEGSATGPIKKKKAAPKKKASTEQLAASDVDLEEGGAGPEEPEPAPAPKKKKAVPKKKAAAASVDEAGPSEPVAPKKKRAPTKKKVSTPVPVHTHELDDETHDDCELCQTHGCPLEEGETEYETVMSPPRTLRERLARAAMMDDFVEDDDEEEHAGAAGCEVEC